MNMMLLGAAALLILLAVAHTVIGEYLIFRHLRADRRSERRALDLLPERRWDSLWSTWHLVSLLGLGFGALLALIAMLGPTRQAAQLALLAIGATLAVSAVYWVWGTRGKHPAWIILAIAAAMVFAGNGALDAMS
ncbi:MAG: hypothetical protein FJX59_01120 [Alphaproteobacteria bacterium]|nr:hypothetical protein [Alphaproteobacteria bacterium]